MIVVCAATGTEAAACRGGIADAGARGFEVLATGVGPRRAREALTRRLEAGRPTLVVSSGFAGALTPGIALLSWVTASAVYHLDDGRRVPVGLAPGLLRVAEDAVACDVLSTTHVLTESNAHPTESNPRVIGGAAAVDMESAALADVCGAAGVPFTVLRLVTDVPGRSLPPLAARLAAALASDGVVARTAHGVRAVLEVVRAPASTTAFMREAVLWRARLRAGWRTRTSAACSSSPSPDREFPSTDRES